jgi:hypothetical protein
MGKFDWYQTTVRTGNPQESGLVDAILRAYPLTDYAPCAGQNGYSFGGQFVRGSSVVCRLSWGGQPGVNVMATSDNSPALADALRGLRIAHTPTRIDTAIDWEEPGLFESLSSGLIEFAKTKRLAIMQVGDWVRGESRTLYVGSKDSPVRLVLYEKGFEQGCTHRPDWVRLEARIRPKGDSRAQAMTFTPMDVFSCGWLTEALDSINYDHGLSKRAIGTLWRKSDTERARAALLKQYGAIMQQWADESGGWSSFGEIVGDLLTEGVDKLRALNTVEA